MRAKRFLGAAAAASLLLAAAACGDDDDAADTTTTTQPDGEMTSIEVTLTSTGFEGMPSEVPAGLVEVTLVNESGGYASFDISRVEDGTTEQEFAEEMAPVLQGGAFSDLFESNVGIEAEDGDTVTSIVVLREGDHIAWFVPDESGPELADDDEIPSDDDADTTTTTAVGDDDDDTVTDDDDADTTTTTAVGDDDDEQGAAPIEGTLTQVGVDDDDDTTGTDDDTVTTTTDDDATDDDVTTTDDDDDITVTDDDDDAGPGPGGPSPDDFVTASLTVTEGDDDAELPEADGEIVATDYDFDIDIDGSGSTINFINDGPQQFHHAIVMDFGTNAPDVVEEAFPVLMESDGDPTAMGDIDLDMDEVDFEFGGSGVFGPDGAAGTFDATFQDGNTYVVVCFIQDRSGGAPHAFEYDMWEVFQVGNGNGADTDDTTTTTEG